MKLCVGVWPIVDLQKGCSCAELDGKAGRQTKQERKLLKFVAEPNAGEGLVDATVELRRPDTGFDSKSRRFQKQSTTQ
jgi:hypothetical protein